MSSKEIEMPQPSDDDEIVEIVSSSEHWNEYTLKSGDKLRMKPIIIEIRLSRKHKDADGNPMFFMKSQVITDVQKTRPPVTKGSKK